VGVQDRIGPLAPGPQGAGAIRRTLERLRRRLVALGLVAASIVVVAGTQSGGDADTENLWAAVSLFLFAAGATAGVWRRPRDDGYEPLRIRRWHRRIFWRVGVCALLLGLVALWFAGYWDWQADRALDHSFDLPGWDAAQRHAETFRQLAAWLCGLAAVPVVLEPLLWRLWPRSLRRAARGAKVELELRRDRQFGTHLKLNPELGAAGRPGAFIAAKAREPDPEPQRITPHGGYRGWKGQALARWREHAAIEWNGTALVCTDARGRPRTFPVRAGARPVAEIVWYTEDSAGIDDAHVPGATSGPLPVPGGSPQHVLLLDAAGRWIAKLPAVGFAPQAVAGVAKAAGLPFAAYDLGVGGTVSAAALLFPRAPRAVRIRPPALAQALGPARRRPGN
jgi:hypothetical protein